MKLVLRRAYTFGMPGMVATVRETMAVQRTPIDMLPEINIPVVSTMRPYRSVSPEQVGSRWSTLS